MEDPLRGASGEPGLTLIETLGWDGRAFPRLDLHLSRLASAANRLGWPCDPNHVQTALMAATGPDALRLRLTLDGRGHVAVTASPMPPLRPVWRVGLAAQRLRSDDPWLTLKSSRRHAYDAARAALAPDIDEALLLNEHGEVCDGTITTLFFDRGQGLRTPPVSSGLLPGVLRAEMLATHQCREERLLAQDLGHVALWVGSSLRGLMPAQWTNHQVA